MRKCSVDHDSLRKVLGPRIQSDGLTRLCNNPKSSRRLGQGCDVVAGHDLVSSMDTEDVGDLKGGSRLHDGVPLQGWRLRCRFGRWFARRLGGRVIQRADDPAQQVGGHGGGQGRGVQPACINQIRGVLSEFGLVFGKSPKVLRAVLTAIIEDASNELSTTARLVLQRAFEHWRELDEHMRWCDRQVGLHVRSSPAAKRAAKVIGIGELGASALTAGVGDFTQFKSGHQFGAWLGVVPRQSSSGGTIRLGHITKRGMTICARS